MTAAPVTAITGLISGALVQAKPLQELGNLSVDPSSVEACICQALLAAAVFHKTVLESNIQHGAAPACLGQAFVYATARP